MITDNADACIKILSSIVNKKSKHESSYYFIILGIEIFVIFSKLSMIRLIPFPFLNTP